MWYRLASPHRAGLVLALGVALLTPTPCGAAPSATATSSAETTQTLPQAKDRAIELERLMEDTAAERVALETRIEVTNVRIFRQEDTLVQAAAALREARENLSGRLVSMYKSTALEPMTLLLTADSVSDFLARIALLSRVAEIDNRTLKDANIAAAQADYQAAALEDLKAQEVSLRVLLKQRHKRLESALAEQKTLVAALTAEERRRLDAYRAASATTRSGWRASSIPIGDTIPMAEAVVEPHTDRTYTVAAYQPRLYRSTGQTYDAVCSWYGNEFNGRPTACGQIFNQDDLTCASRTLAFGTRLALTRDGRRIVVVVTDRGPFIAGRDLDLSREAARRLGFSGVETVHVEVVTAVK